MIQTWNGRVFLLAAFVLTGTLQLTAQRPTRIATHENRSPAGELRNGILSIRLEIGEGQWYPESEDGEAITVYAFGETGKPLQNPGPLIRAQQGTEIRATVHNSLSVSATVHGLHERPGEEKDAFTVQPGATQEVRFQAGAPGVYYYWASTTGNAIAFRTTIETQLHGALVIDPPGIVPDDRIFVIGVWFTPGYRELPGINDVDPSYREIATINGKSWPHTESLTARVGEKVRWRWLNPTVSGHGMHLHGFYYQIDAVGDAEKTHHYKEDERPRLVTQHMRRGRTFDMTWVPTRAGRWLYHCHMLVHMMPPAPAGTEVAPAHSAHSAAGSSAEDSHPEHSGMGSMVLGITVLLDERAERAATQPVWKAERRLQLLVEERQSGLPRYALSLHEPSKGPTAAPPLAYAPLIGPPIVLQRGQPVEIEVVNRLKESTAIHWHGIELESYYDGVPDWTGTTQQITPAISPGTSFVARMASPEAGTFIYHTHWHDERQLTNGVYGPLIVMPPGEEFDPTYDKLFVLGEGSFATLGDMLLVNGSPQPPQMQLKVGKKYRLRIINIGRDDPVMNVTLSREGTPVQWRSIAKDGSNLPSAEAVLQKADLTIAVGETYDFEYEATKPEELSFEVNLPIFKVYTKQILDFRAE